MSWIGHFNNRKGRGGEEMIGGRKRGYIFLLRRVWSMEKALEAVERSAIPTRNLVKEW